MGFGTMLLGVIFLLVVAPLWILFHYVTRWRSARTLSVEDERALGELWDVAQRMEARLANLEHALDTEAPGWRAQTEGDQR